MNGLSPLSIPHHITLDLEYSVHERTIVTAGSCEKGQDKTLRFHFLRQGFSVSCLRAACGMWKGNTLPGYTQYNQHRGKAH